MRIQGFVAKLLLICFSAFLGHSLVPHHHHAEVYHHPIATDCPFEHGDHEGHSHDHDEDSNPEGHPIHCHAFNDVVFQKYSIAAVKPWTGQSLSLLVPGQLQIVEVQAKSSNQFTFLRLPGSSDADLGSRALRAPPFFS